MSDLEKRYEVISEFDWWLTIIIYLSDKSKLVESNIKRLVCETLEANWKIDETWVDLTKMKTTINEYILQ